MSVTGGEANGLATMNSLLNLGRLRDSDATDAQAIVANPDALESIVGATAASQEATNRRAAMAWLVSNLIDEQNAVDPHRLAAALGAPVNPQPAPAPAVLQNAAGLEAALTNAIGALQALLTEVHAAA